MRANTTRPARWIESMRAISVLEVAQKLGLHTQEPNGSGGGAIVGCPACGEERRHRKSKDKRGAVGIRPDGQGFSCFQCGVTGDQVDLVSLALRGGRFRELSDAGRGEVRAWCRGLTGDVAPRPRLEPTMFRDRSRTGARAKPLPSLAPSYPPMGEVNALLGACVRVDAAGSSVASYLTGRWIPARRVADLGLAHALRQDAEVPSWARMEGRPWSVTRHHLVVPLVDAHGVRRSVVARSIDVDAKRKSTPPVGFARKGLLMACPFGRLLLESGSLPPWWSGELCVIITEGEMDFLAWATAWGADEHAPAVFGVMSGSWTTEHATRLPEGEVRVLIATDSDEAGDRYALQIASTLANRSFVLERYVPAEDLP